jgi:hypothetical protein
MNFGDLIETISFSIALHHALGEKHKNIKYLDVRLYKKTSALSYPIEFSSKLRK